MVTMLAFFVLLWYCKLMNITVGNNIYVDGKYMHAKDIEPEHFRQVLILGREAISFAIDGAYQKRLLFGRRRLSKNW